MLIYLVRNLINGKIYVGQTVKTLNRRMSDHCFKANAGSKFYFHQAIKKYGEENFEWGVLRICENIESLNVFEQYYILYYNSTDRKVGYNLQSGGQNSLHSDESKEKMSIVKKNISEKTRKKMSKGQQKRYANNSISDETKEKMSIVKKGENNPFYRKKHSIESREKMSEAKKGNTNAKKHLKN